MMKYKNNGNRITNVETMEIISLRTSERWKQLYYDRLEQWKTLYDKILEQCESYNKCWNNGNHCHYEILKDGNNCIMTGWNNGTHYMIKYKNNGNRITNVGTMEIISLRNSEKMVIIVL